MVLTTLVQEQVSDFFFVTAIAALQEATPAVLQHMFGRSCHWMH